MSDPRPKPDVDAWAVSTSTQYDEDDDTTRTTTRSGRREDDDDDEDEEAAGSKEMDWTAVGEVLKRGRVKERIHELNKINSLAVKGEIPSTHLLPLVVLLPSLSPRYDDLPSNEAVVQVLSSLVKADTEGKAADRWQKWILEEVARCFPASGTSTAPASHYFLSLHIAGLIAALSPELVESVHWSPLVFALATTLEAIVDPSRGSRVAIRKAAVRKIRKLLRTNPSLLAPLLSLLTAPPAAAHPPPPAKTLPLLGLAVDVCLHLRASGETEKGLDGGVGVGYVEAAKGAIIESWKSAVMGTSDVGPHVLSALNDFFKRSLTPEDLTALLPSVDKAFVRSPESAFSALTSLLQPLPFSPPNPAKTLLPQILTHTKSPKPEVRNAAIEFFALLPPTSNETDLVAVTDEIAAILKGGKSVSADHRQALYTLLHLIPTTYPSTISAKIAALLPPLIQKETVSEAALAGLLAALAPHLASTLVANIPTPPMALSSLSKEMITPKATSRRLVVGAIGEILWKVGQESKTAWSVEADKFAETVVKGLVDGSLKSVVAAPLTASGGVGEGFVAVAAMLGPLSKSGSKVVSSLLLTNVTLQAITSTTPKPSFLLWDKAQRKATSVSDEVWLLRGLQALVEKHEDKLVKDESLRTHIGLSYIYLALSSPHPQTRRATLSILKHSMHSRPKAFGRILRDSIKAWLLQKESASAATKVAEEESGLSPEAKARQVLTLLSTAVSFAEGTSDEVKEDGLTDLLILAHHAELGNLRDRTFVDLALAAKVNIPKLIERNQSKLLKLLTDNAGAPPKSNAFATAAFRAGKTLAFISPEVFVPELLVKIKTDLDPLNLDFIGAQELGIWETPAGTAFVDVIALKKAAPAASANRSTAAMDKWEKEVRESAAKKRAAAGGGAVVLSKQDQALVTAQLALEADIRAKIVKVKAQMERGLALIRSLIAAEVTLFKDQLTDTLQLVLDGPLEKGSFLVGEDAFNTFLLLGECCSPRLGLLRPFVGVAILRNYGVKAVPQDMQEESLSGLVLRVLYRLRTLSEQSPFDAATYAYVTPLLTTIIAKGGAGSTGRDSEEATEQLALALEIMTFHCGEFSDTAFPRLSTINDLLQLIATQPSLRKAAASALIDLGEALKENATATEIDALIKGTLSQEVVVRNAALQALQPLDITELDYSNELWIVCHDEDAQNSRLAQHLWEDNGLDVPDTFIPYLLPFLEHDNSYVRTSTAAAFAEAVIMHPELISQAIVALEELYTERAKVLAPEFDQFGMVKEESLNRSDPFHIRVAVANTVAALSPSFTPEDVVPFFEFLVQAEALGDRSPEVRRGMLEAGGAIIDTQGKSRLGELIAVFEACLGSKSSGTEAGDHISEAVVILFGRLASYLDSSDPRIPKVVDRLVEALKTPSEVVQAAVSDCIPALVKRMQPEVPALVARLYDLLIHGKKYAERRGAAYGLAGVVKGRGLSALKEFDLIDKLREAAKDKDSFMSRQGALLAFETLSATLGRIFEPYVLAILPLLLSSFGDATADVRDATQDASKVIMSRLSGHCVNIVLPSLLEGLEEKQWRTKKGSIELLGAMAFCAPRQLALSLPTVIPELTAVLTDSHAQVRQAANASLKKFGEVIHNPEIKALVPTLLKALVDPTSKTNAALGALLNTSFAHFIDSPSLALVAPIIERGLRERSAQSKRKAVQILGNLSSLTDPKDFVPYLITFLPLVHIVLVDPVPEARATAAKALGTLVERLGEDNFPTLVQDLLQTLRSDTSGVDRQGAAQGLSEVLSGLGMDRLEALLPEIITNASSPRPYVREGFISLLIYLPATFGHRFSPHLGRIIPPILGGLADESEYVRDASMRAGKMIISNYSTKAVDLLLPELEKGMVDENWRIRQSSISLIGELLFRISGISGKAEIEEEDGVETGAHDSSRKALLDVLGQEKRDRVLSALYIVRQDAVNAVRTGSLHIWKALVQNTPRTLREILPSVINQVIALLASPGEEQRETASRTLGELCKKNGERILMEMIPILKASVSSVNPSMREGGCLAFSEILESAAPLQLEEHQDVIIASIRTALVDENATVRAAAARTFDQMQQGDFGTKAIDQTIPTLLEALRQPGESSETALRALKEVMAVRANSIFPVVIPTLIALPISAFNARALGSLVSVAGNALSRRLIQILTAIVKSLEYEPNPEILAELHATTKTLLESIEDEEGVNTLLMLLLGWAKADHPARRVSALSCFRTFCEVSQEDFSDYRVDWIRRLVASFADRQPEVVEAAWEALESLVKSIPKDELEELVVPLRAAIESTAAPGFEVPGFSRPKGVQSIVPILLAGVLGGTYEQREAAAGGIGDLVLRTSEAGIKPYIVQLTGPLIRVISSQTFPPAVKNAILGTLTILLQRVPHLVRPFQPQLQRTFVKSLSDTASISIRNSAAEGLGVLMVSQTRVDPLITELVAGARASEDEISASMVHALACVCKSAGKNLGDASKEAIEELVHETFRHPGLEPYNAAIGQVVAGLALNKPEDVRTILETRIIPSKPSILSSVTVLSILEIAPDTFETLGITKGIVKKTLLSCSVIDNPGIGRPSREAREIFRSFGDDAINAMLEL